MKKISFLFIFCLLLCGCGSKYQVSELTPSTLSGLAEVKGSIKKIKNDSCEKYIQIIFDYQNGSIKGEANIVLENIEKDKIVNFEKMVSGISDTGDEWLNYKLKFKRVECWPY